MDDCVRDNEAFERATLKKLFKEEDIGLASESELNSSQEMSTDEEN